MAAARDTGTGHPLTSDSGSVPVPFSRAEVSYSDAQVVDCCFHELAAPGKYTLVLANRARKKGSDYKLCRHCRAVTVIASPS